MGDLPQPFNTALNKLFELRDSRPATPATGGPRERRGAGAAVVKVIPLPRANNISIMLTQFASFKGPEEIKAAVLAGSEQLGLEHLSLLMQIAPSPDEAKALRMYRGPFAELSPPEQFLLVMAGVPRLVNKVQALIFRKQFEGLCGEAMGGMDSLRSACDQIRSSDRLRRVLAVVLSAGNQLNAGTARGSAGSIRLDSLLKLGDVKVTVTPGMLATTPRRHSSSDEQQPPAPASNGAEAAHGAASGSRLDTNGHAAQPAVPLPPVKTLLDFVAWVVLQQEAAGGAGCSSGSANGTSTAGSTGSAAPAPAAAAAGRRHGSSGGSSNAGAERLAMAVKAGFLGQQLPDLALAVRRMQTDVADSLRGLNAGMLNLQQELDAELEQHSLKAGTSNSNSSSGAAAEGSNAAAAAAAGGSAEQQAGGNGSAPATEAAGGAAAAGAGSQAPADALPPFAAMLSSFMSDAKQRQAELDATSKQTADIVRDTIAWLGESVGEQEQAAVFELLLNFQVALDVCCKKVHRQVAIAEGPLPR